MGLKGRLEDLPLLDMLQIIAFSKKSGYLRISGTKGRGAVMLKEGRILFSYSWSTIPALQELVRQPETITPAVIREHVEASLRELGAMREGSFRFELADPTSEEFGGVRIQPFLLPRGLDAQEILLDLAVQMDDERREATSLLEMAFHGDPPPEVSETQSLDLSGIVRAMEPEPELEPEPEPLREREPVPAPCSVEPAPKSTGASASAIATVVLVDDEAPVRDVVGEELAAKGYRVLTASNPKAGAKVVRERLGSGESVMVVADLKMPTSSERSFFGGFELVRRIRRNDASVPVLLMAESLSEKAKARAKQLGIRRLVSKPTLSKIDAELYVDDLRKLASTIDVQLKRLFEDGAPMGGNGGTGSEVVDFDTDGTDFLSAMTRKLVGPGGSTDVSRLVMTVARRFLERGVLFVVKGDLVRGLAGFGLGKTDSQSTSIAQRVVIELAPSPPFTEVVRRSSAYRVTADIASLDATLFGEIGRGRASEAVLIPLLYNRAALLVLYGDNANSGRALGALDGLELFIAQAGMALENKLLQQKLSGVESHLIEDLSHDARG